MHKYKHIANADTKQNRIMMNWVLGIDMVSVTAFQNHATKETIKEYLKINVRRKILLASRKLKAFTK